MSGLVGDLEQYIHGEVFVPSIVVVATEAASRMVKESTGLTVAELLAPFAGFYTPLSVQCRVLDRASRISGFKARVVDANTAVFKPNAPEEDAASAFLAVSGQNRQVGFMKYFSAYCGGTEWSPFDCLNQPIATILVASTDDANPVDAFEQLSHVANQPELCRSGVLDPTSVRVKLLLHNKVASHTSHGDTIVQQLIQIYGPNSVIFAPINSGNGSEAADIQSVFSRHAKVVVPNFSWTDVTTLNLAMEQVVTLNAIPWLERKLQQLELNIAAKRKGLRNQLRNFLRPSDTQPVQISLQQVEWQCRLAGDIAFHLRAYDTAFAYYRNVSGDFKQERSMQLAAAGCYEMSALTGFLAGGVVSVAELSRFFDTATDLYLDGKCSHHAVRCAILQSFVLRGRAEAADKIVRINGSVAGGALRSAVLLDLAAQLHAAARMWRKEAFTRVLAGHMFNKAEGAKEWALEAYKSVIDVYGPEWAHIRDHLLFTMSKLEFGLGRYAEALHVIQDLFTSVLNPDRSATVGGAEKHGNYVKLLAFIGKALASAGDLPVLSCAIPEVTVFDVTQESVMLKLVNPLHVVVDVDQLSLELTGGESERSGIIHMQPSETKFVPLQIVADSPLTSDSVKRVSWILFGLFRLHSSPT